ncbi:MAG: class I SAM-dependent methyltransferase [Chlorobium sp.]|jgi:ubiquinone/menaquinone biosynthesis C-methylase UbiE|uniref:class I SAM-dependent methyltransferase n=1 Tax=Chlorobium sp. TaxID=1095 RepID=UPI0025BC9A10|nr:class I SAM-dependent methyltransferase [Chlorobium sp.]MCF8216406.1 class I SAM-dependent methyltransferase [Chlorobium sp.]MCF8271309.1 class I SAM-dependent methyltransferase [Chlorobium sp.]MCF8287683.1 class I SAM-dependent methyltransferase [Chlorobium sp.]MCF8291222.1 class I SAM-dependent methyltransferase [Chlorobium sp.]MCF8385356.1 class I SAM-dependent methyltransferase [Chlorobium sp.]
MTTIWNSSERFDRSAAQWDENPRRTSLAANIANAIVETAKPRASMQAMEFGCGTGLVTLALAPYLQTITAIDTSEEMLAQLQKKIETLGIRNVHPILADLVHDTVSPLATESLDFICSSMTLHHIADISALLSKLNGLLICGGILAMADLDREDGLFHDDGTEKVHHGFERPELQNMLEDAGFRNVSFRTAYEIKKTNRAGRDATYPIFLVTALKP